MKKELGKWLMDIAKYITTVVIISSIFSDMSPTWAIYIGGFLSVIVTLMSGLMLVHSNEKGE